MHRGRGFLTYVVPKLVRGGEEHFSAVPFLLSHVAREIELRVIAERGDGAVEIPGATAIAILPSVSPVARMAVLLREVAINWQAGCRSFFVRTSQYAAIVTGLWCRLKGGRLYYWHCSAVTYSPFKSWRHFKTWAFSGLAARLAFKLCYKLVTAPESMRDFYVESFGVPAEKILILSNDVDVHRFRPATAAEKLELRNRFSIPSGRIAIILHRLSPVRRHVTFLPHILSALTRHPDCCLVIVGDGPERPDLEKLIDNSPVRDRVMLVGSVAHEAVHEYLRAADVFLNPSYVEGFPRVVIEAMACGLPSVVTDAGGTSDLLPTAHRRFIVSRDEPERFAKELEHLLGAEASQLRVMGEEAARHVQKYSTENVAQEYVRALFPERNVQDVAA
jgi:glycosyltransferase involved in cell wall biosynthesis